MALAVSDAQDTIAYLLYGKAWSSIGSEKQGQITAVGAMALSEIEGWADLFDMGGSTSNAPAVWLRWLTLRTCALVTHHRDQERYRTFDRDARAVMQSAIETIGTGEADDSASTVTFTLEQVRKFVFIRAARQRVYPTIAEIDQAIQGTLHEAYNAHLWRFRRLLVRITIADDGTVTIERRDGSNGFEALDSGQKFDMLSTRALYYDAASSSTATTRLVVDPSCMVFATADQFAQLMASDPDATGRPRHFRIEGTNSADYAWHWWPFPDAEYKVYAEVFLEGPQNALGDTSFSEFPAQFHPILRDSVLLRVLSDRGAAKAEFRDRVLRDQESLLEDYEDVHGPADDFGGPVDVYGDTGGWIGGPR